ncbi:Pentatricopeptide repeat-containing protein, chloroplastic [Vitis vinifera]|uniref:Pentatricopeptide repeat-containing protein, chloroplastic n=1 Tax=Vitis vinifera TaxID=29760 RepID=A0A438DW22_VITVI|nr:Pentatricopeptide repeat-containing protein, chloroplastic [Vitis vinifera]
MSASSTASTPTPSASSPSPLPRRPHPLCCLPHQIHASLRLSSPREGMERCGKPPCRFSDDGPLEALKLFDSVTRRIHRFTDATLVADSRPDTAAYNAVLNACANLGDTKRFLQVFEEMTQLEDLDKGIQLCMTTLHSLVAAYVGFGDLETAEKLVQAMREGRQDLCKILRDVNSENPGYMKEGRVTDTVRMLEAMRHQDDSTSQPDHVTYTTVVSALVKAGSMDRARQVLAEMTRIGVPANRVTYNILLKGYCEQLQIDKAKELLMTVPGLLPTLMRCEQENCSYQDQLHHFNESFCLVWSTKASKQVQRMRENGFYPNVATYGSLANGIALARKPGEALLLWNEVKERCVVKEEGEISKSSPPPLKPDEGLLDTLADICVRAAFFRKALEIVACMEENGIPPNKSKYTRIYVEMHSRMFTSKHASKARQDRRSERKRAAEAFKFWLGLPNSYYGSEWRLEPIDGDDYASDSV